MSIEVGARWKVRKEIRETKNKRWKGTRRTVKAKHVAKGVRDDRGEILEHEY
jgi:hypothetical protein